MTEAQRTAGESQSKATEPAGSAPPEARIVDAGRRLFFSIGFSRVSTDRLAREAKVSKATLYKYFPDIGQVLMAVVKREGDSFEIPADLHCADMDELKSALTNYGTQLLSFLNKAEIVQFTQLMHEEARAHPDIARQFYAAAYGRSHTDLARLLREAEEAGYLRVDCSAEEKAEQLIGMWEALRWTQALMGIRKRPFPRPADWAAKCVETLFGGVANI